MGRPRILLCMPRIPQESPADTPKGPKDPVEIPGILCRAPSGPPCGAPYRTLI